MGVERQRAYFVFGAALAACQVSSPNEPAMQPSSAPPAVAAAAETPASEPGAQASPEPAAAEPAVASAGLRKFSDDVVFLSKHGPIKVLESPAGGRIAVSGKYQARVMTSAVEANGASLGFV